MNGIVPETGVPLPPDVPYDLLICGLLVRVTVEISTKYHQLQLNLKLSRVYCGATGDFMKNVPSAIHVCTRDI